MFRNVIVGVDHHEGGRDAAGLAQQLGSESERLILAHVYTGDPYVYRGVSPEYAESERARDLDLMAHARADAGLDAELRWHRASSVVDGLNELCAALDADLLVVGASHHRGYARLLQPADAGALDGDAWSVAIAPVGYSFQPAVIAEIGVGYDGTAASEYALRVARELACTYQSRLSAFNVVDVPPHLADTPVADELVHAARRRMARPAGAEPHAASGRPSEELTLYSRLVDLLVIGAPGDVAGAGPRRSGVARELARSSRCPLLVVRASGVRSHMRNGFRAAPLPRAQRR
jgi:nucleotide-binding universal stress UspA family protein